MINGINANLGTPKVAGGGIAAGSSGLSGAGGAGKSNFSDMLRNSIDEVSRLQREASEAVESVVTGRSDDVVGVMSAMEKSDMAFKTLLAIRAKLMDAYEEIKSVQV